MRIETAQEFVNDLLKDKEFGCIHHLGNKMGWRFWFDDGGILDLQKRDDGQYHTAIVKHGTKRPA